MEPISKLYNMVKFDRSRQMMNYSQSLRSRLRQRSCTAKKKKEKARKARETPGDKIDMEATDPEETYPAVADCMIGCPERKPVQPYRVSVTVQTPSRNISSKLIRKNER